MAKVSRRAIELHTHTELAQLLGDEEGRLIGFTCRDKRTGVKQRHATRNMFLFFPYRGRRIGTMNNNGWQQARREAGLPLVRVDDLRHSFACRLRAAGVSAEAPDEA